AGRAGGARRDGDALEIERRRHQLSGRAGKTDVERPGERAPQVAVPPRPGEREQRGGQPIAQRREPDAGLLELGPRQPRRRAEADDAGDVLRPRPALALLVTARPARLERRAPSQENRARAL